MFSLGPLYDGTHENRKYSYLFWQSLRQPACLSLQDPRMFNPARHFTFGTHRHFTEVTPWEIEAITEAMHVARLAWMEAGQRLPLMCAESEMRAVLGKMALLGGYQQMDTGRSIEAVVRAVRHGDLIFVPRGDDLRACVGAIQKDRMKRLTPGPRQHERFDPRAAAQRMMGKPPRMPQNLDKRISPPGLNSTPLDDARSFEYEQADLSDDIHSVAARGVSEAHEAECFAQYERDMDECAAYRRAMGGQRFMDACSQRAFQSFQQCRGY